MKTVRITNEASGYPVGMELRLPDRAAGLLVAREQAVEVCPPIVVSHVSATAHESHDEVTYDPPDGNGDSEVSEAEPLLFQEPHNESEPTTDPDPADCTACIEPIEPASAVADEGIPEAADVPGPDDEAGGQELSDPVGTPLDPFGLDNFTNRAY